MLNLNLGDHVIMGNELVSLYCTFRRQSIWDGLKNLQLSFCLLPSRDEAALVLSIEGKMGSLVFMGACDIGPPAYF